jgi:hypothetical protein
MKSEFIETDISKLDEETQKKLFQLQLKKFNLIVNGMEKRTIIAGDFTEPIFNPTGF